MITIDSEKCIGCGLCAEDCLSDDIDMIGDFAVPKNQNCIECGHCLAICPANAVDLPNYSVVDLVKIHPSELLIDPVLFLKWMKTRRSIRSFTKDPVDPDDLNKILETGRFSPTGGNLQNVSFVVVQDSLLHVRTLALESLYAQSELTEETRKIPNMERYAKKYKQMYEDMLAGSPDDRLFFGAPCVILLVSPVANNAAIAAAHMETMIYSLGLGMVYSGFTTRAVNGSKELKEYLGLGEGDTVQTAIVLGRPAVKYQRSVARKIPRVIWR